LGIDPGTNILGYGVVAVTPIGLQLLKMNVLRIPPKMEAFDKLAHIHKNITEVIDLYRPTVCAIEAPFFGKNVQSMLKLGRAQGVAIAAAIGAGIPVFEYSPKKIKQSVTGNGNAGKEQVAGMVCRILQVENTTGFFDATDAVAVAVCHHLQNNAHIALKQAPGKKAKSGAKGWGAYIAENPGKVLKGKSGSE
jgi:crossover junction endodeoxyribonuclease RuvC